MLPFLCTSQWTRPLLTQSSSRSRLRAHQRALSQRGTTVGLTSPSLLLLALLLDFDLSCSSSWQNPSSQSPGRKKRQVSSSSCLASSRSLARCRMPAKALPDSARDSRDHWRRLVKFGRAQRYLLEQRSDTQAIHSCSNPLGTGPGYSQKVSATAHSLRTMVGCSWS